MKLYQVVLIICLFFSFNSAMAQYSSRQDDERVPYGEGKTFVERLYFGGGLDLRFGTPTYVNISPLLGYRITEKFSAGIRARYRYIDTKGRFILGSNNYLTKQSIYGGGVFSRLFVSDNIFLHGEYESLGVQFESGFAKTTREWVPGAFVGGGYAYSIGNGAMFSIRALYNVLYDDFRSPYPSPLDIQAGISLSY